MHQPPTIWLTISIYSCSLQTINLYLFIYLFFIYSFFYLAILKIQIVEVLIVIDIFGFSMEKKYNQVQTSLVLDQGS